MTRPHTGHPSTRAGEEVMPKLLPSIAEDLYEVGAHMAAGTQRQHSSVDTFMKNIEVESAHNVSSQANI